MNAYFKYYKWAALIPSVVTIVGYIIYSIYDLTLGPGAHYKSEWVTAESMQVFAIGMAIAHCLLVCLLSSTLFLLKYKPIRKNFLLSLLCCFLPAIAYLVCVGYLQERDQFDGGPEPLIFLLFLTVPFFVGFALAYIKFRRATD